MSKSFRQKKIIEIINKERIVKVRSLAVKVNSSEATIRRDLEYLQEKEYLRRIPGGAVFVEEQKSTLVKDKKIESRSEKSAIGKEAANLIQKDSIVCFDSSKTVLAVIENLPADATFTAITTSLIHAKRLCNFPNVEIILVGGIVQHAAYTCFSFFANDFIKNFNADLIFLSARAVNIDSGTLESEIESVEEKRLLMSISKKIILVADNKKFTRNALCHAIPIDDIDLIITDSYTDTAVIKNLRKKNKETLVVEVT